MKKAAKRPKLWVVREADNWTPVRLFIRYGKGA